MFYGVTGMKKNTGNNWEMKIKKSVLTVAVASAAVLCGAGTAWAADASPSEVKYQELKPEEGRTDVLTSGELYIDIDKVNPGLTNDIPEYIHSTEYNVQYQQNENGEYVQKTVDGTAQVDAAVV